MFGSRALGTYKAASDVDLAIFGTAVSRDSASKLKFEIEEESYLPYFFDVVSYNNISNADLKEHIDRHGMTIYRQGWRKCKLGSTGIVITGKTPSIDNPEDWGKYIHFITPSDYKNYNKIASSSIRMLSAIGENRQKNRLLPARSVLVTCIGSDMGKSVINSVPCVTNQQINAIIPNDSVVSTDYLYYLTVDLYETLRSLGGDGTAVPILNKTDFENINIKLPHLPEQRAIAAVLSSLDDKIDLLHRQNKTLEAMAETLFWQWFVEEADLKETIQLGEFADNVRVNVRVENLVDHEHYVGLEHIPRKNIALASWGSASSVESNKSVFEYGDILFGKLRSYFHKVVFAPIKGVCSTDIMVIRPKKREWFSFCLFWFFSGDVVEYSDLGSGGTRMPRTNWEIVSSYQVPAPDINLVVEFDRLVRPMLDKISANIESIQAVEKLRDTLLPKLMSGEARVAAD